jgi:hypothetical protein
LRRCASGWGRGSRRSSSGSRVDRTSSATVRLLLTLGVVGPPLFLVVALIEGATREAYDAVRLPISLLALGDFGWMQVANFVVFGALEIAFAVGLARSSVGAAARSRTGPILIGIFGAGVIAAGLFVADPGGAYPPGAAVSSGSGTLHDLATLVLFGALIAAAAVFARSFAGASRVAWAWYSALTAALVTAGFLATFAAFNGVGPLAGVGGLVQRVTVFVGWLWLTLLAVDARSRAS